MRIVPVIDLLDGHVVRGVAGERQKYRPIQSLLTRGSEPLVIAQAIRNQFGIGELYVADLGAIVHQSPHLSILKSLADNGFTIMADVGIRHADDAEAIVTTGVCEIVAGLETLAGENELAQLCRRFGANCVVFSLDLQNGRHLGDPARWPKESPFEIAATAIAAGISRLIVLDIAQVGTAAGVTTLPLCEKIRAAFPDVELISGGGVRGVDDLVGLKRTGIDGVLVASALHNGAISPESLRLFQPTAADG